MTIYKHYAHPDTLVSLCGIHPGNNYYLMYKDPEENKWTNTEIPACEVCLLLGLEEETMTREDRVQNGDWRAR